MDTETVARLQKLNCKNCGAPLQFMPGTNHVVCLHCGGAATINASQRNGFEGELDFNYFLNEEGLGDESKQQITAVTCHGCGAAATLKPHVTSDDCAFCGTPLVIQSGSTQNVIKPGYILPFLIDRNQAFAGYTKWISGLWFAPGDLKKQFSDAEKLHGMYIPYWTYDSDTVTHYTGQRGEDYYETETYTTVENGKSVTKTRRVTKTRWYSASGTVNNTFNDILVLASKSLPEKYALALEPWDMKGLMEYNDSYLAGFQTEMYQVGLKEGFAKARAAMEDTITETVNNHIGGDRQRISNKEVLPYNVTFKHILLPVWISAYRYNNKVYRFMINGRTGEVQGERPYSWGKILLFILAIAAIIAVIASQSK